MVYGKNVASDTCFVHQLVAIVFSLVFNTVHSSKGNAPILFEHNTNA